MCTARGGSIPCPVLLCSPVPVLVPLGPGLKEPFTRNPDPGHNHGCKYARKYACKYACKYSKSSASPHASSDPRAPRSSAEPIHRQSVLVCVHPSPAMASRSVVARIDWPKLASALSLTPATTSALTAFRKRNVDAHNKLNQLRASKTEVDLAYYRGVLKNSKVIDEIEKAAKSFKPITYDVGGVLKGIEAFEGEAVKSAQETEKKISEQLKDLEETVKNIDQARHPEELSVRPPSMMLRDANADGSWMICTRQSRICIRKLSEWCKLVSGWYAPLLRWV